MRLVGVARDSLVEACFIVESQITQNPLGNDQSHVYRCRDQRIIAGLQCPRQSHRVYYQSDSCWWVTIG